MFVGLAEVLYLESECLDEGRKYLTNDKSVFQESSDVEWVSSLLFFMNFSLYFNELNTKLKGLRKQVLVRLTIKKFQR
jgi:hypothetical protein